MKKYLEVVTGAYLSLVMMSGVATAAPDVTNTINKGSVLFFPSIDIEGSKDTIIRLQNDYSEDVAVKCNWKNGTKFHVDFQFVVTKSQPVWFSAKHGSGSTNGTSPFPTDEGPLCCQGDGRFYRPYQGELMCWAVNVNGSAQVAWNHLAGSATVIDYANLTAYEYNSWNFRAVDLSDPAPGKPRARQEGSIVGNPGSIRFNGVDYDACPQYLIGHFSPRGYVLNPGPDADTEVLTGPTRLVVASCRQDVRQAPREKFTKLRFYVTNGEEAGFSGSWHCMDSWADFALDEIDNARSNMTFGTLKTATARFMMQGVEDRTVCRPYLPRKATAEAAGVIGIMVRSIDLPVPYATEPPTEAPTEAPVDPLPRELRTLLTTLPLNPAGQSKTKAADGILWDPN